MLERVWGREPFYTVGGNVEKERAPRLNFRIAYPSARLKCSLPKTVHCITIFCGVGEFGADPTVSSQPLCSFFPVFFSWTISPYWISCCQWSCLHCIFTLFSVFSFVSSSGISAHYLASAQTPMWCLLGLLRRVHMLSPSSNSLASPSFMAWACTHFRVVVESLKERVGITKVSQCHARNCESPSP